MNSTKTSDKRAKAFSQLEQALSVHADFEEERIYPLLQARMASKDMALEAIEEHAQIKRLLYELRDLDPADDRWQAKATIVAEDVHHHVKEEESEDLPELKKIARANVIVSLSEEFEALRAK